ncbi:MAG: pilus assembly protein N-terminal domain-containing protein [Thermoguttaceae bacterium]|jgi:Flp pilus assembly secretin CpaC
MSKGDTPVKVDDATMEMRVARGRGRLLQVSSGVRRMAVVDPAISDVVQVSPSEILVLGEGRGATHVTVWRADERLAPVVILVRVTEGP